MKTLFILLTVFFSSCTTYVKETKVTEILYCFDVNDRFVYFLEHGKDTVAKDKNISSVKAILYNVDCSDLLNFTGMAIIEIKYLDDKSFEQPTLMCAKFSISVIVGYFQKNTSDTPDQLGYKSMQIIEMKKCE